MIQEFCKEDNFYQVVNGCININTLNENYKNDIPEFVNINNLYLKLKTPFIKSSYTYIIPYTIHSNLLGNPKLKFFTSENNKKIEENLFKNNIMFTSKRFNTFNMNMDAKINTYSEIIIDEIVYAELQKPKIIIEVY